MANKFLAAANRAVLRHGTNLNYTQVITGAFDIATSTAAVTETTTSVLMYKRQIKTSQFNFPNLIGKEVAMFYIPGDAITFTPRIKDRISDGVITYVVDSIQETLAFNEIVLYRLVCVKS